MGRRPFEHFDRIQKSLFSSDPDAVSSLSPQEQLIRIRYMAGFTFCLDNPTYTDKQVVSFMMRQYQISNVQAYQDVRMLKILLGNVQNASKEWYRHMCIQMCQEAYNLAKKRNDAKAMALAADKLGKYTRCDQADADELPWDQIVPPSFEPSSDISLLGFKPDPDIEKKRAKMIKKYSKDIEDAVLLETPESE